MRTPGLIRCCTIKPRGQYPLGFCVNRGPSRMSSLAAMSEPAWITRWQAREALKNGQPEEAHRLFDSLVAAGNRRAWALRGDVVLGYVERAEQSLRREDVEVAWADLLKAEGLLPNDAGVTRLRETLTRLALAEARAQLENAKPLPALE